MAITKSLRALDGTRRSQYQLEHQQQLAKIVRRQKVSPGDSSDNCSSYIVQPKPMPSWQN